MIQRLPIAIVILVSSMTAIFPLSALAVAIYPDANPNNAVMLPGTTVAMRPELAGVVLADVIRPFSIDFGAKGTTTGWVQDRVVRSTLDGTLDFYYRVHNDESSMGSIDFATREGFSGWTTDVDYRTDGLGSYAPVEAYRNVTGNKVWIDFRKFDSSPFHDRIGELRPGKESLFTFIKTNATDFNEGGVGVIEATPAQIVGTFPSSTFSSFQPTVTAVPLPPTLGLLATGIFTLFGWVRRYGQV